MADEQIKKLVPAMGSLLEGFDRETVLMSLGSVVIQQIVNGAASRSEAEALAEMFGRNVVSCVSDAFDRGFGKP